MTRTRAKFRIMGRLDSAARVQIGTVTIDRSNNVVEVRPLRRRKTWLFTLDAIIDAAVQRAVQAEVRERRKAKRAARKGK